VSTYYLRNTTEHPTLLKRALGALLPLSLKRQLLYLKHFRRIGDFTNPRRFSEKMQWRIINDRRERLRHTCDKRATKELVAQTGMHHGIDVKIPKQIAWSSSADTFLAGLQQLHAAGKLPQRWVMKPNHSSGRALAIEGEPDWSLVREAARAWLAPSRFYGLHWIWPYATAESGLLAEEFIPGERPPMEWQLWLFGGEIKYTVVQQRAGDVISRSVFDSEWGPMTSWYRSGALPLDVSVPPKNWEKINRVACSLGDGWDMVRVDLYEDEQGGIWFGELTPYPSEGLLSTAPSDQLFDEVAGDAWALPVLKANERA
jgi:hypothetical protein